MQIRPRRSVLYMPGINERALQKARTIAADSLILDLEDSVAPDAKKDARALVLKAIKEGGYGNRELVLRGKRFGGHPGGPGIYRLLPVQVHMRFYCQRYRAPATSSRPTRFSRPPEHPPICNCGQ